MESAPLATPPSAPVRAGTPLSGGLGGGLRDFAEAFRVTYGPQDRPRSTISGPRRVCMGRVEIGARQRAPQSPSRSARLATKRPWSLDATARSRLLRTMPGPVFRRRPTAGLTRLRASSQSTLYP